MQAWIDGNKILGDHQNDFRSGRRLDYSLSVLTQCVEISRTESRPLYVAIMNISGVYNNVNKELLWRALKGKGIRHKIIEC